jgi:hypothetical protein
VAVILITIASIPADKIVVGCNKLILRSIVCEVISFEIMDEDVARLFMNAGDASTLIETGPYRIGLVRCVSDHFTS